MAPGKIPPIGSSITEQGEEGLINSYSNNVYVLDGGDYHAVVGVVPVQDAPQGLTVDNENNWLFVTNTDDHSISVVQTRSHYVIKTCPTQQFPIDVSVDSSRNMLYVIHRNQPALFVARIILE